MTIKNSFIHLHTHTEFSFLDSTIRIDDLVQTAKQFNMTALAITDHGGLFGAMKFNNACRYSGIKPVFGMKAYIAPVSRSEKCPEHLNTHIVLLAENDTGWMNLMALSSISYLDGFCKVPRIDMATLREHSKGLIATSGCTSGGAIQRALLSENREMAKKIALDYLSIFGEGNFFLEINNHGTVDEMVVADGLIKLGRELGIPLVATNDVHYLKQEHAASHEILLCIKNKTTLSDPHHPRYSSDQYYFKSPQEMEALFPKLPMALRNTVAIADRCNVTIGRKVPKVPGIGIPGGVENSRDYLKKLAREKLPEKYPIVATDIKERLEYELSVICANNDADYMLLMKDLVDYLARKGTMVCMRGCMAGSLTAYVLGITTIDPIKFGLLFERFINPELPRPPYIGLTVAHTHRGAILEYAVAQFGRAAVCEPCAIKRMKPRRIVRAIAVAMNFSSTEAKTLADMVAGKGGFNRSTFYKELFERVPAAAKGREIFRHAEVLEDIAEAPGNAHGPGLALTNDTVAGLAPLFKLPRSNRILAQFDQYEIESAGFLLVEISGLREFTVVQEVKRLIARNHRTVPPLYALPLDDEKTLALFNKGDTAGVYQFDDSRLQKRLRRFDDVSFTDLVALVALYRPGPMEWIATYILRRNGKEAVTFLHPMLEEITQPTMGLVIFQEQVMRIAQQCGGMTLGQSDIFRRALGKRASDAIKKFRAIFMNGALLRGVERSVASELFDLLADCAPFAFNQSHATQQTYFSYLSGYLRAHYPEEFETARKMVYGDD